MAIVNNKTLILLMFIALLFLARLVTAFPTWTISDSSTIVDMYTYARDAKHHNESFETLDALFAYADALKIWRFSHNCSTGC
jgi:thymidine kinase